MTQELEISRMLTVSLSHLTNEEIEILKSVEPMEDAYSYTTYSYYTEDESVDENELDVLNKNLLYSSKTLVKLFQLARKNKCHWIRFDVDGPIIKDIQNV